jgi:hypothetical protein
MIDLTILPYQVTMGLDFNHYLYTSAAQYHDRLHLSCTIVDERRIAKEWMV